MTTLHQQITAALVNALPNTWAVELPPRPEWPAAVFDVETTPEAGWVMGGGYDQHDVTVIVLARGLAQLDTLLPLSATGADPIREALQSLTHYQWEDACGDADYESDPQVYARSITVRLRTPSY